MLTIRNMISAAALLSLAWPSSAINIQQFTRSNSLTFEVLDDARTRNSHVFNDYDLIATFGASFVNAPLIVKNQANTTELDSIIDNMYAFHLGVAFYVKPWLQIGATSNFSWFENIDGQSSKGLADIEAKVKFRLISDEKYAFSVAPTITIPTQAGETRITDASTYDYGTHNVLSNDSFGVGGRLIFEYLFDKLQIVGNLGFMATKDAKLTDPQGITHIDMSQQLYTGVGAYLPLSPKAGINAEWVRLWSSPLFNKDINPNEFFVGASFGIKGRWNGFVGAGLGNLFDDADGNDYRFSAGIKYAPLLFKPKKQRVDIVFIPDTFKKINCRNVYIFDNSNSVIVRFPRNVKTLDQISKEKIYEIISKVMAKRDTIQKVSIVGHTSKVGPEDYNLDLSQKRSEAIKELFIERGVPASLIYATGKGEQELLDTRNTSEAHRVNRRTEFHIELKESYQKCLENNE